MQEPPDVGKASTYSKPVVLKVLLLWPFHTLLCVTATPNPEIISLILHKCNFVAVTNHTANI